MHVRAALTGIVAGVAAVAAFYYPVYVMLPGLYVHDWPSGSLLVGSVFQLIGLLMIVAGGMLAAWWGRGHPQSRRITLGMLAGMVAGFLVFTALGAGAAGVVGLREILLHGPGPTENEQAMMRLTAGAVVDTVWLTYLMFWVTLLGGGLLGALGGLVIPQPATAAAMSSPRGVDDWSMLEGAIFIRALLFTGLTLIVAVAIFPNAETAVNDALGPTGSTPNFPVEGVEILPIATALALFVAAQAGLLASLRHISRVTGDDPAKLRINAYVQAAAPVVLVIVINLIQPSLLSVNTRGASALIFAGEVISLALASAAFFEARRLRRRDPPASRSTPADLAGRLASLRKNALSMALGLGAAMAVPIISIIAPPLNLVMGVIPATINLSVYQGMANPPDVASSAFSRYGSAGLVNAIYQAHWVYGVGTVVVSVVALTVTIGVSLALTRMKAHAARPAEAAFRDTDA